MSTRFYAKKRKTTIFGKGSKSTSVSRPYVNKRNRLMLGEGKRKRKKRGRKTVGTQKGGFLAPVATALAPIAVNLISKLFS